MAEQGFMRGTAPGSIPEHLWPTIQATHERLMKKILPSRISLGKVPLYVLCRFCNGLNAMEWVKPENHEDFAIRVVSYQGCPVCQSFRHAFTEQFDFLLRVVDTHVAWYHQDTIHVANPDRKNPPDAAQDNGAVQP